MTPEEFLRKAAAERLAKRKKPLSNRQKRAAIEFCITRWKQVDHKAETALREMETMAGKL